MNESDQISVTPQSPPRKNNRIWIILLVIVAVMVCACLAVIALLAILGPTIGNVFSNIIQTPQPIP